MPTADDEIGKTLRANWLLALNEIAALGLQRRFWLDPKNRNPHWSYIEFVECFPSADQLVDAAKKGWLSPVEADLPPLDDVDTATSRLDIALACRLVRR